MNEILSAFSPKLPQKLNELRARAKEVRDPTAEDDVLQYVLTTVAQLKPKRVLEIGCAEGLTSIAILLSCEAELTAIEKEPARAQTARENFLSFGVSNRVTLHEGDAGEILPLLTGEYDLIFLDGPKVQYRRYLPECKRLLREGGVLLSDDILLFGWVTEEEETPQKRRALVEHIREYLRILADDSELVTSVLRLGQGLAVSVKKGTHE